MIWNFIRKPDDASGLTLPDFNIITSEIFKSFFTKL